MATRLVSPGTATVPAGISRYCLAVGLALAAMAPLHAQTQREASPGNAQTQAAQTYAIAAGPLDQALTAFAVRAGVAFSFDAALVAGRMTPGLNGRYTVFQGFDRLLAGTGLEAVQRKAGSYALQLLSYDIPAGPLDTALDTVLEQFARRAQVRVIYDRERMRGLQSPGFRGAATIQAGLASLLGAHPLAARNDGADAWRIQERGAASAGSARSAAHLGNLPVVIVTAKRDDRQEVFETAGSVAVVTREEIDRLPPRNTGDVLADVPGVYTSQSRQNPGVSVNMRGLQDFGRVNVMIDGTRQNYQQSGHGSNGAVYLDPELLSGVDISKGPSSTIGGAGMIAGSVNFRTLEISDLLRDGQTVGGRVNATTGSNAYHFGGSAALGLRAADDLDLVFAVGRKTVGEFRKGERGAIADDLNTLTHGMSRLSAQDQWSALAKADWRPLPGHEFKLSYIGMNAHFDEGASTDVASGDVTTHNHIRSDTLQLAHRWRPSSLEWVDLRSSLYYTRTLNKVNREAGSLDANLYRLQYQTSTVGGTLQNQARMRLGGLDAVLDTGGEFFHDWTDPRAQSLSAGADAGTTALYTGATPEGKRTVASLFSQATLLRGDWLELTGGLRYDWYGLQGDGRMRVGSITNPPGVRPGTTTVYTRFGVDRNDAAISPRISLAIKPSDWLQLFTSYGQGMRPPALTETLLWGSHTGSLFPYYPNPALRAERSRNWEIGANAIFEGLAARSDKLRMKAAWFDSRVKNYITLARVMSPISAGGGGVLGPYAYMNMDSPFRSKGLELQLDYDNGDMFGAINFTRMIIDPGQGGYDPFPLGSLTGYPENTLGTPGDANIWYVLPPRRNASVTAGVRLLDRKLTLGARLRMQSPSRNSSIWTGDMYNQKSWRLYDFWASYEMTSNVTLRLAVNNLFDTNYSEMNGSTYWVGPGRTALATVSVRF
ncbi:Hemin receptor precursor [Pigmentiphaga humi]|uniref:Hemin receptor n=1 Tax=Pigmentiphaga humi TaxID=2478468 RepID=A0A3P4AWC5_9BURK|nr:TonB-dependent receptor [Pigmentiphaga humi]VCU68323.1 Hemin receptor precursor [Pigmentiphaga humi]